MKVSHVLLAVLGASIACSAFAAPALDGTLKKAKDTGIFTIGYRDASVPFSYLDAKGNKIAHTIDPRTGRSAVSRLLSVTVAAPTCAEADALGTMFLAMGADDALAAAKSMPQMKVYFILADGADAYEEYVSPAMEAAIMQ